MRIIAGKYRGKILAAPNTRDTRPTSDRARESVFNVLAGRLMKHGVPWSELSVLDAFAGTGALGVEAASRGVQNVSFMEKDAEALKALRQNAAFLERDGYRVSIRSDVLLPPSVAEPVDLVFMDPPYGKGLIPPAIQALSESGWLGKRTLCVIETEKNEKLFLPNAFTVHEERMYGKAKITFASVSNPLFS